MSGPIISKRGYFMGTHLFLVLLAFLICFFPSESQSEDYNFTKKDMSMGTTSTDDIYGEYAVNFSSGWIVVKFVGQLNGNAGIAFPDTSRVPPVDIILKNGIYLRDLVEVKRFSEKVRRNGGLCYIVEKKDFDRTMLDNKLFEGF